MLLQKDHFSLGCFEGPLEFLLYLIQKEEIEIYDVSIQEIIQQFINKLTLYAEEGLEKGAEFIGIATYLVWLKSKNLLPSNDEPSEIEEGVEDPRFEIIHHLIDYCRFKRVANELGIRQDQQQECYFRGIEKPEWRKPLGIDHISLEDLTLVFKEMLVRASEGKGQIYEENWKVSDKIRMIRQHLSENYSVPFIELFRSDQSRIEMIVIFLAILELMKSGELSVGRIKESQALVITSSKETCENAK